VHNEIHTHHIHFEAKPSQVLQVVAKGKYNKWTGPVD